MTNVSRRPFSEQYHPYIQTADGTYQGLIAMCQGQCTGSADDRDNMEDARRLASIITKVYQGSWGPPGHAQGPFGRPPAAPGPVPGNLPRTNLAQSPSDQDHNRAENAGGGGDARVSLGLSLSTYLGPGM